MTTNSDSVSEIQADPIHSPKSLLEKEVLKIQKKFKIIGRKREIKLLLIAIKAKKHVILEGAVGTGKTYLARALAEFSNAKFYRSTV